MPQFKYTANKRFYIVRSKTHIWEPSAEHIEHTRFLFILSGSGVFNLDGKRYSYMPQGVILLKPGQRPTFQENDKTELFIIAFDTRMAEDFQKKKALYPDFADIYKQAERICECAVLQQGKPIPVANDQNTIDYLISLMSHELMQRRDHHYKIVRTCIEMMVTIVNRNNILYQEENQPDQEEDFTELLLKYITDEVLENRTVKISDVQIKLGVSEDVINISLLNRTGMSFRKFIRKVKIDLFRAKMLNADLTSTTLYTQ